jgi:hypothetical protein
MAIRTCSICGPPGRKTRCSVTRKSSSSTDIAQMTSLPNGSLGSFDFANKGDAGDCSAGPSRFKPSGLQTLSCPNGPDLRDLVPTLSTACTRTPSRSTASGTAGQVRVRDHSQTAKTLDLEFPPTLLALADDVIEYAGDVRLSHLSSISGADGHASYRKGSRTVQRYRTAPARPSREIARRRSSVDGSTDSGIIAAQRSNSAHSPSAVARHSTPKYEPATSG